MASQYSVGLYSTTTNLTDKTTLNPAMELLQDIYHEALRWYNLPFTALFGLVLIYWAFQVVFGLFGAVFDFGFDGDVDFDSANDSVLGRFSYALSDGEAPFMWALTFFITLAWAAMMALNYFFNPVSVWGIGIAIMAGSLAVAIYITRIVMRTCARLFRKLFGIRPQNESFIGAIGIVTTSEVNEKFGEIEINHHGVPCRFNVQIPAGERPLLKGDHARILKKSPDNRVFIVALTHEDPRLPEEVSK